MSCQAERQTANNNEAVVNKANVAVAGEKENSNIAVNENKESAETEKTPERDQDGNRKAVSGKEVTGTFQYEFTGKFKGNYNEIKILALGNNKVKVDFSLTYPFIADDGGFSANVGEAQGEAAINGDTAVYSTTEGGTCEIKIKFVKPGQIEVSQTEKSLDGGCGFGLNVSAEGTYKKVSSKKPTFDAEN